MKEGITNNKWRVVAVLVLLALMAVPISSLAADIEANAFPEFDIWTKMDKAGKNRICILNSYATEPAYSYEESALGISWDQRFHKNWSWRAGARYVWKEVDPPDKNETRVVLDLPGSIGRIQECRACREPMQGLYSHCGPKSLLC